MRSTTLMSPSITTCSVTGLTMASTAQHTSDLSENALPHIKEMLRNSHMMEYTSGPKHQIIIESVMISKSHYDLSIALFQAVEEHAIIMDGMKQPGDGGGGGGGGGAMSSSSSSSLSSSSSSFSSNHGTTFSSPASDDF